jgi:hypothetical protein
MSRDKQIILGVVVLAGLGGLVYYQQKKDAQVGTPHTTAADLPDIKGPEDVDKISITNGDKGEVVLERVPGPALADGGSGDKWEVTKPVKAPANQSNVKSLVDNMKELKAKELVAGAPTDDVKKSMGLDPAHALHVMTWKGADKKLDDTFGSSSGRGEMMMVEGKPAIYAASGYSSYLYNREVKTWRDQEIFKFDDANASQLTISNKNGDFSFTKGDKWSGTLKGKPIERFDEEKVKDALRAFKALNADDFGDGKSDADTGLDKPEATVMINLKDNAGKYVLHVGNTQTGSSRYAKKDGDETTFVIASWTADWATANAEKFAKPVTDAGAPKDAGGGTSTIAQPAGHPKVH